MLGDQGIAGEIQRKKEAYQGNPQALQQQYQQSQQLVDLLALQQLKSEKEAAARQMQMQMQQNPATIAQQREQEVLGMIKQEQGRKLGDVAKRTAGTLGQINQRAQQNVQRTAKQGLPAMGGPQMASGGIVGFFGGGSMSEEARRKLRERRGSALDFEVPETPIGKLIREIKEYSPDSPEYEKRMAELRARRRKKEEGGEKVGVAAAKPQPKPAPKAAANLGGLGVLAPETQKQDVEQGIAPPTEEAPTAKALLAAAVSEKPQSTTAPKMGVETSQELTDTLKSLEGGDPAAAGIAARDRAYDAMGKTEGEAAYQRKSDALETLDRQQLDPKKLGINAQRAGLLAMSRSTLGRGARASFNTRMQQEDDIRNRLVERHNVDIDKISFIKDVGQAGETAYQSAFAQAQQNNRTSAEIYGNMNSQDRADARERSRQHFDKAQQNERHWLNTLIAAAQSENAALDREEARLARDAGYAQTFISNQTNRLTSLLKAKDDALLAAQASDPEYQRLYGELTSTEPDDDDYLRIQKNFNDVADRIRVSVEESSNGVAMEALIERVQEQIAQAEARLGYGTGEPKKESQTPDLREFGLKSVDDLVNVTPVR